MLNKKTNDVYVLMDSKNLKNFPKNIVSNQALIQRATDLGCTKAKLILTKTISMAHWIRLHCQFGCPDYGSFLTCPPHTPDVEEMGEILIGYEKALLINVNPATNVREVVVALEGFSKENGFIKAFALCAQPCELCKPCTIATGCQFPEQARPTLQSCGIDVNKTIHNNGWQDLGQQSPCMPEHSIGMVLLY